MPFFGLSLNVISCLLGFLEEKQSKFMTFIAHFLFNRGGKFLVAAAHRCWMTIEETLSEQSHRQTIYHWLWVWCWWRMTTFQQQAAIQKWDVKTVASLSMTRIKTRLTHDQVQNLGQEKKEPTLPNAAFAQFVQPLFVFSFLHQHG